MRLTPYVRVALAVLATAASACDEAASALDGAVILPPGTSPDGAVSPAADAGWSATDGGFVGGGFTDAGRGSVADAGGPALDASAVDGGVTPPTGDGPTADSASKPGPFGVAATTEGLRDSPAYGSQTLHYPTSGTPPYPIVAVVPGFVSGEDSTKPWGPFLASHGMVALTIGTNTSGENPAERATALTEALKTLEAENTRQGSPVQGKLDTSKQAVIGWSMGGGGAVVVAEQLPTLKATIALAPWNPTYSYSKVTVPALLLAIKTDSLAGGQATGFYSAIPASTPKAYWEVDNDGVFFGGHDTFNNPASLGGAAGRYGLSFLKVFLVGDERYRPFLKQDPPKKVQYTNNL
jgi:dienelactone hydrolase